MSWHNLVPAAYVVAGLLFIGALAGLSRHETARRGNVLGIIGMIIALAATLGLAVTSAQRPAMITLVLILAAMAVGGGIGVWLALRVKMTAMPQLVAMLHSFVGLAAVLVGFNTLLTLDGTLPGNELAVHRAEIYLGVFIGAVTFSGSVIAWGKLSERFPSRPLMLPHRHLLNLICLIVIVVLGVWFTLHHSLVLLIIDTVLSLALGLNLVASIGGGDMPVVVSMLNSYSGWAAAAAGFMLDNDLLIITGALVGSSGAILSYLMCKAMNRSFVSVIAGGFGSGTAKPSAGAATAGESSGTHRETDVASVAALLGSAHSVIIAPGYGMAVAQAQHPVAQLTQLLRDRGISVRFAIHPVAGRLPGHMNVLLAEARLPYDIVEELDEINTDFAHTDVVLVIGANDTVNPAALEEADSPIAGMPVLWVWQAREVIVFKRSMATGYAGVANPLFFRPNTQMLFGDARQRVEEIIAALRPTA